MAADRAITARPGAGRRRASFRLYGPLPALPYFTIAVAVFVLMFAAWWVAARIHLASSFFLPSPWQVGHRVVQLARDGTLWQDTRISFIRISIGWFISTAIGLPIGILIGTLRPFEAGLEPAIDFFRYMPAVAFVPLTIVWVGVGESQKYLIIFIGTFFQQALMVMDNVKRVPREYVDIGRTLGMRESSILLRIVIPASAPALWDTLRITIGWAWTWLVVAELVAANSGLGHRIMTAERFFETDTIFVGILTIGVLGLVMDLTMKFLGRRLFRWSEKRR